MRVQTVIALGLAAFATTACGQFEKDHRHYPNGTGYNVELSAKVADLFPEDVFPQAAGVARLCDEQKDLAACTRAAVMLLEGARIPVEWADETSDHSVIGLTPEQVAELIAKPYSPIPANQDAAVKLFQEVCATGYYGACTHLANLQLQGVGGSAEEGAKYFVDGCTTGISGACAKTLELQQAGQISLSDDELNAQFAAACDSGVSEACRLNAGETARYGAELAPSTENATFVEIRKRADRTTVLVYADSASAAAIATRAEEAFGENVNVVVRDARGAAPRGWNETLPQLFVLAAAQEGDATARLSAKGLTYNALITNADTKASYQSALQRLAGDNELRVNLDQQVVDTEEGEVAVGGNVVGGESADAVVAE